MLKIFRVPIILLGVAVLIGAGLFVSQKFKEKEKKEEKIFRFNSLDIVEVNIKRTAKNDEVHFKKLGEDQWNISHPIDAEADPYIPNGITRKLEGEEPKRSFKKSDVESLSDFGLEPPEYILTLKDKEGKEYKLLLGKKAPVGYSAYATKEGDENIYLVSASILNDLDREIKDYRNRKIMDFSSADVSQLKIKRSGVELVFEKETEEKWKIMPQNLRASGDAISRLISTIRELKVVDFVDDYPADLAKYGLTSPSVSVEVIRKEKEPLILKLGKRFRKEKEELVYAMKEGKRSVYSIGSSLYDECMKEMVDFREKKPISFYTWKVNSLNISTPKGSYLFEKTGEDLWYLTIGAEKMKAKRLAVEDLLRDIRNTEVREFTDDSPKDLKKYGLEPPPYIVRISAEGESPLEVFFSQQDKKVYFKVSHEPYVYATGEEIIQKIEIDKEKYREEEKKEGEGEAQ